MKFDRPGVGPESINDALDDIADNDTGFRYVIDNSMWHTFGN